MNRLILGRLIRGIAVYNIVHSYRLSLTDSLLDCRMDAYYLYPGEAPPGEKSKTMHLSNVFLVLYHNLCTYLVLECSLTILICFHLTIDWKKWILHHIVGLTREYRENFLILCSSRCSGCEVLFLIVCVSWYHYDHKFNYNNVNFF